MCRLTLIRLSSLSILCFIRHSAYFTFPMSTSKTILVFFAEFCGISCLCLCVYVFIVAVRSCKSTELLDKSTGSSLYNGVFTLLNTSYSGRPVYRHERHPSLYLYYSQQINCSADGAWVVGDGFGHSSSMSMFAVDDAQDPMLISPQATWRVYDRTTNQFSADSRLTLVCYASQR